MRRKRKPAILSLALILSMIISMGVYPQGVKAAGVEPAAVSPSVVGAAADPADGQPTDGAFSIWINEQTDVTYETINEAVAASTDGDVIHLQGDFTASPEAVASTVVNKSVTLDIAGDTTMKGTLTDDTYNPDTIPGRTNDGIRLQKDAKLQTSGGAVLTMQYFNTAIVLEGSSVLTDGHYELSKNIHGITLTTSASPAIAGSGAREDLTIRSTDSPNPMNSGEKKIENAAVDLEASLTSAGKGRYANGGGDGTWHFENVSYQSRNTWIYQKALTVRNSDVTFVGPATIDQRQVMTVEGDYTIENSNVTIDGGGRSVQSVISHTGGKTDTTSRLLNSTLTLQNALAYGGGYNMAVANLHVIDSTINVTDVGGAALGANYRGYDTSNTVHFTFEGNSVVNTKAQGSTDAVGANPGTTNPTVVTGGSYKVYWNPDDPSVGNTPVNDKANGSERLTLLTLADPSVTELQPMNSQGARYTYLVVNASDDGEKYVWVPGVKATFKLDNASAAFADGSKDAKVMRTARGYSLSLVKGNEPVGDPTDANGVKFLGWFYKDASGTEKPFDYGAELTADTDVYAKWDSKVVVYHNQNGVDHIVNIASDKTEATALDFAAITEENPDFAVSGKDFVNWTTAADGSGTAYEPGDALSFDGGVQRIDLYANYNNRNYTVTFSANGGYFTDASIFAQHSDLFDLTKDTKGRITAATLKKTALYGEKLWDLLPEGIAHDDLKIVSGMAQRIGNKQKADNWYTEAAGRNAIRFDTYKWFAFLTINGENPAITEDTTYYLGWTEDTSVETIGGDETIPSDLWGSDPNQTATGEWVWPKKDGLSVTGAVDISDIKNKIQMIEKTYGGDANPEQIELEGMSSSFMAVLMLPEGIRIDPAKVTKETVKAAGLGDCFTVSDVQADGQKVSITFTLVPGLENFAQLKRAVLSTGVPSPADTTQTAPQPRRVRRSAALSTEEATSSAADGTSLSAVESEAKGDTIMLTVEGLSVSEDAKADEQKLTADGQVTGQFDAYAIYNDKVKRYKFQWTGTQKDGGRDELGTDGVSYTWRIPARMPLTLPGDLLVNGDTENAGVYGLYAGDSFAYTGALDVASIKNQIETLKSGYEADGGDPDAIAVRDVASSFTATLKVADGVILTESLTAEQITFNGEPLFKVTDVHVDADSHTVAVDLTLDKDYSRFMDLYNDVKAVPDELKLDVPGMKLDPKLEVGTTHTTTGTVTGEFRGLAVSAQGKEKAFYFSWEAVQKEGGKDKEQAKDDDKTIGFTIKVNEVDTMKAHDIALDADMLVTYTDASGETVTDSEEKAVPTFANGASFDLTGRLYVQPIKEQIEALLASAGGDASKISVSDVASTFTAKLTLPDGLILTDNVTDVTAGTTLTDNNLFKLASVKSETSADGTVLTAVMTLKKKYDASFADLYKDVTAISDELNLTVKGVTIGEDVPADTQLTSKGTVTGTFTGQAEMGAKRKIFDFSWKAKQKEGLKDFTQTDNDTDIWLTVQTKKEEPTPTLETTSVSVRKVWAGEAADQAVIHLLANGTAVTDGTVTLTKENEWSHTFTELPKLDKDGKDIVYTVAEDAIEGYEPKIEKADGEADFNYVVTNTKKEEPEPTPKTTSVSVRKVWAGEAAGQAVIHLLANGTAVTDGTVTLTAEKGWSHTFAELLKVDADGKEIDYTVAEDAIEGYETKIEKADGEADFNYVVTNTKKEEPEPTPETTSVSVRKVWAGEAADQAVIHLLANGTAVTDGTVTLTAEKGWSHTFADLPKVDADGKEIDYTVAEDAIEGYETKIEKAEGEADFNYVVTNTKKEEPTKPDNGGNGGEPTKPDNGGNGSEPTKPDNGGNNGEPTKPDNGGNNGEPTKPDNGGNNGGSTTLDNGKTDKPSNGAATGTTSKNANTVVAPETGDQSAPIGWVVLMVAGLAVIGTVIVRIRKRK